MQMDLLQQSFTGMDTIMAADAQGAAAETLLALSASKLTSASVMATPANFSIIFETAASRLSPGCVSIT